MINIQNAQKNCRKNILEENGAWIRKKVIHNFAAENALKWSYTRSYSRYPQNESNFFAHFFCRNKRLFC